MLQISFVNSNFPAAIFSIKSSEPTTSAPLFLASSTLFDSHKTATLLFFPEPLGRFTTVRKLKSPPFDPWVIPDRWVIAEALRPLPPTLFVYRGYRKDWASQAQAFLKEVADASVRTLRWHRARF